MATFDGTRDSNVGLTIDNNSRLSLTLDTRNQFDDPPVNFDAPSGDFDLGGTEIPNDVTDLSVSMVGSNQMELTWTPVEDLDISWYEIRYQDVTSGATWNQSSNLAKVVRRKSDSITVNAKTGAFLIKAVDKLGNSSASESIVYTNISGLQAYKTLATYSE